MGNRLECRSTCGALPTQLNDARGAIQSWPTTSCCEWRHIGWQSRIDHDACRHFPQKRREAITEKGRYQVAQKDVPKLKVFWTHLAVFVVVNAGWTTLNLVKTPERLWFQRVFMGWGAGILLHCFQVFGGEIAKNWEEKKIQDVSDKSSRHTPCAVRETVIRRGIR